MNINSKWEPVLKKNSIFFLKWFKLINRTLCLWAPSYRTHNRTKNNRNWDSLILNSINQPAGLTWWFQLQKSQVASYLNFVDLLDYHQFHGAMWLGWLWTMSLPLFSKFFFFFFQIHICYSIRHSYFLPSVSFFAIHVYFLFFLLYSTYVDSVEQKKKTYIDSSILLSLSFH